MPISQAIQVDDLNVVRGVFTARLHFQDSFGGADTLIKITVRPGASSAAFTSLVPATPIDPTPYAQGLILRNLRRLHKWPAAVENDRDRAERASGERRCGTHL